MDEIDQQLERDALLDDACIAKIRAQAAAIPVGEPGECQYCGKFFTRTVRNACGKCRDARKLP